MNLDWTDDDINNYLWNKHTRIHIIVPMKTKYARNEVEYFYWFAPVFMWWDLNNYICLN